MRPFLAEIAEKIYETHKRKLDSLTLIFPNRRAILYFRKHLSSLLDRPSFSPALLTIEDFISSFSSLAIPDKLELVYRLYKVYSEVITRSAPAIESEPFDQFYFWGEMLLRDFDEADKYMVKAEHLFKDLSHQKELDATFDFLTDEQKEFLHNFWLNFEEKDSAHKKKFLHLWRQLAEVYKSFREKLKAEGLAYDGMLHREVAENIKSLSVQASGTNRYLKNVYNRELSFIGFNALTKAEEIIITHFVDQHHANVYWDVDAYYVHNNTQEAGSFFRQYQQHAILGKTFPADIPSNFKSVKNVKLFGAPQPVGQAKLMAQVLQEKLLSGFQPEETLVVLPDEKLLLPSLHGISAAIDNAPSNGSSHAGSSKQEKKKLNVTMGLPLNSTPMFNLIELLIDLQINRKDDHFNHRAVLALLGHPYVAAADLIAANTKRKEILQHNWVNIPQSFLGTTVALHRIIFKPVIDVGSSDSLTNYSLLHYLKAITTEVGHLTTLPELDKEYCFHFLKLFNRMEEVLHPEGDNSKSSSVIKKQPERNNLKSFLRLFRQITRAEKIPFTGEPLQGLQVMGVLETRNLDFKNVFILSLNEGAFPSFSSKGSYIPFTIRKAYGLPIADHQDAIYAYLFYRILQRAENIFLFYNSETDVLGQGEMSRYLQQLVYESGLKVEKHVLHNTIQPKTVTPIVVEKDVRIVEALARYCKGERQTKELTPSALNDYIECRLKFYFRHIARIREAREVDDDLDARLLGTFLHRVMELFYTAIIETKKSNVIEAGDFSAYQEKINTIIDHIFIDTYHLEPGKKVEYEGQRLVVKEIVKRFADRIIALDKAYAPFTLEALERKDITHFIRLDAEGSPEILLGGTIDRADRKENVLRVIDYKTGKDQLSFESLESLFDREGRRNKAAFQTMLYAMLYKKNMTSDGIRLIPGLLNRVNLFDDNFTFGLRQGKETLYDASSMLEVFESFLKNLLEELYDPKIAFDQTENIEICQYCPYRGICYR